tara:strand:- start:6180 stop:6371 length:192 start_codon:yes stop_codon:yes gene_type:complete
MKIGDLVTPRGISYDSSAPIVKCEWVGIVVDMAKGTFPVVYWNQKFPHEIELPDQIELVNESR